MLAEINIGLIVNIVVIALLLITITYAYILNNKINLFQKQAMAIQTLTDQFVEATNKAQAATETLKQQGIDLTKDLDKAINKGERLYADIDFLLCRAEKAALSLESPAPIKRPKMQQATKVESKSEAEQELLKAIASARTRLGS